MIGQSLLLASLKLMLCFVVVCSEQILGDTLTYECTVMRGHGTIWRGNAFDCASSHNEIYLIDRRNSSSATCNNGKIVGHILPEDSEEFYTSQLSVTISCSSDLIGKMVQCASVDPLSGNTSVIENSTATIDILPYPSPEKVSISAVNLGLKEITFTWRPVIPDYAAVHYHILASNCGSCPNTTNHTNVICTDVHSESICTFGVQTVVCGNITGKVSAGLAFNITETSNEMTSSNKVKTISISIFIIGISTLLITIVIVILVCSWLHKQSAAIKTSSRFNETAVANSNCDNSSSLQSNHATSQQENKGMYEYSQLMETPVNLKQLLEKLQGQISKQWYQLGLTLGLPMDVLEGFNLYSENDCLVEVLDYWLKHHQGKPTWQEITDAQKKVEMFNIEQDTGAAYKKTATTSDIPPPKPPRRTSSVIMKKPVISPTETATDDPGHEYEVIH